jgi:glycosyltransferase involved in cell wall biosynthesis
MPNIKEPKKLWPSSCTGPWIDPDYDPGLVSVIAPTYNRAHLIRETLDSVWDQTYRPIELVVVDDGSTDNTEAVVREWSEKTDPDEQFEFFYYRQDNKGAPAARNLGAMKSRGEYIQFWDCEDIMTSDKLATQVDASRENNADIVVCNVARFQGETGNRLGGHRWAAGDGLLKGRNAIVGRVMETGPWMTQAVMLRRDLLERCGPWHPGLRWNNDDFEFGFRAALLAKRLKFVDQTLSLRRAPEVDSVSLDYSDEAIMSMMRAAELVRSHLEQIGLRPAEADRFFRGKWIRVSRKALGGGHRELALRAVDHAAGFAGPLMRLAIGVYGSVIRLGGCKVGLLFLQTAFFLKHLIFGYGQGGKYHTDFDHTDKKRGRGSIRSDREILTTETTEKHRERQKTKKQKGSFKNSG